MPNYSFRFKRKKNNKNINAVKMQMKHNNKKLN